MNWPYKLSSSARSKGGPSACNAAIKPEDFGSDINASPGLPANKESPSNAAIKPEAFELDIGTCPTSVQNSGEFVRRERRTTKALSRRGAPPLPDLLYMLPIVPRTGA